MNAAGFALIAGLFAAYAVLDGYDLGAGAVHLIVARTQAERAALLDAIGPFWNANEVVLIAAAAILFGLFPRAYAAAFSGFYLPFTVLLWLLMIRGGSIEMRNHLPSGVWRAFWDAAFSVSSVALAFIFGVAIGNVVRGVPLNAGGYFEGTFGLLLNPYALAVGALAVTAMAIHGAAYLWWRTGDRFAARSRRIVVVLWPVIAALYASITWATQFARPLGSRPLLWLAPLLGAAALGAIGAERRRPAVVLLATSVFLLDLVGAAAATIFPDLLPSSGNGAFALTVSNAASPPYAQMTGFWVATLGLAAVLAYSVFAARRLLARSP